MLEHIVSGAAAGLVVAIVLGLYTWLHTMVTRRRKSVEDVASWKKTVDERLSSLEDRLRG